MNDKDEKLQRQFLAEFSDVDDFEGIFVKEGHITVWVNSPKTANAIKDRISSSEAFAKLVSTDNITFKYD